MAIYLDSAAAEMEGGKTLTMAQEALIEKGLEPQELPEHDALNLAIAQLEQAKAADSKLAKLAVKRRRTIKELIETEKTYASDLAVVRDIYLQRARGVDFSTIQEKVMQSGLGLSSVAPAREEPEPGLSCTRSRLSKSGRPMSAGASSANSNQPLRPSSTFMTSRRNSSTSMHTLGDSHRTSLSHFGARASVSESNKSPPVPLKEILSPKDVWLVFANLEEIADLAESFAAILEAAQGNVDENENAQDDKFGEAFVEMIPRIQLVYSKYCARHHRAIVRLTELEPQLKAYLSECKVLSTGRTTAWDLASLLIKPVQRCLKYPLLLEQLLALTPGEHSGRKALDQANTQMLAVAEAINQYKKSSDAVGRAINKRDPVVRRDSTRSVSSSVTKRLLRSSQKAKSAIGLGEAAAGDEMFDTLVMLVNSTRDAVSRFRTEMKEWQKSSEQALDSQVNMLESWISLYAPLPDEREAHPSHYKLVVFLDDVLVPLLEGPWTELDHELRKSLFTKADHLLSLFDNPKQVIEKRNDKKFDHQRYLAKKSAADLRSSEDFLILTSQLLEELPKFLSSVSKYFAIIVNAFSELQTCWEMEVKARWEEYSLQYLQTSTKTSVEEIKAKCATDGGDVRKMMASLIANLKLTAANLSKPPTSSRFRDSHASQNTLLSPTSTYSESPYGASPVVPQSLGAHPTGSGLAFDLQSYSISGLQQNLPAPQESTDSMPSLASTRSSTSEASTGPPTPPPKLGSDYTSAKSSQLNAKPVRPTSLRRASLSDIPTPSRRRSSANTTLIQSYFDDEDDDDEAGTSVSHATLTRKLSRPETSFLYYAEAHSSSKSNAFRSGFPILSYSLGDVVAVEVEEADDAAGGSGWLLCVNTKNEQRGFVRTEDFSLVD